MRRVDPMCLLFNSNLYSPWFPGRKFQYFSKDISGLYPLCHMSFPRKNFLDVNSPFLCMSGLFVTVEKRRQRIREDRQFQFMRREGKEGSGGGCTRKYPGGGTWS